MPEIRIKAAKIAAAFKSGKAIVSLGADIMNLVRYIYQAIMARVGCLGCFYG
jgi:hypothetical protein